MDKTAVELLMELMPYSVNGKLDHNVLFQMAQRRDMKITDIYDLITTNIFRSPRLLILAMVIDSAKKDLANTMMTIEEVAEKNNFSSPNYFIAMFFRRYGKTPAQWRAENHGNINSL